MEVANNGIRNLIQEFKAKTNAQINPLSMKLKGTIGKIIKIYYYFHGNFSLIFILFLFPAEAEVNGGTAMYERAFINDQYEEAHPEDMEKIDRLKDLMATQIPLLSIGLQ